jgi:hypothetical protein
MPLTLSCEVDHMDLEPVIWKEDFGQWDYHSPSVVVYSSSNLSQERSWEKSRAIHKQEKEVMTIICIFKIGKQAQRTRYLWRDMCHSSLGNIPAQYEGGVLGK